MSRKVKRVAIAGTVVAAVGIGGVAVAGAAGGGQSEAADGGNDTEQPARGDALSRASAAALAHTGGGRVTDSEVGDEQGYYEIEIERANGRQVDVHLDRGFKVLGQESDGEAEANDD